MSSSAMLFVVLAVTVAALLQGVAGFGFSLIAGPALFVVWPGDGPATVLLALLVLTLIQLGRRRPSFSAADMAWIMAGRLPGAVLGALVTLAVTPDASAVISAAVILGAVAVAVAPMTLARSAPSLGLAGAVSGVTETLSGVGGPPVALLYRKESAQLIRDTMTVFFLLGVSTSLLVLALMGAVAEQSVVHAALIAPAVWMGLVVAPRVAPRLDRYAPRMVVGLSCVSALSLIVWTLA